MNKVGIEKLASLCEDALVLESWAVSCGRLFEAAEWAEYAADCSAKAFALAAQS